MPSAMLLLFGFMGKNNILETKSIAKPLLYCFLSYLCDYIYTL